MEIIICILLYLIAAKGSVSVTIANHRYIRLNVREALLLIPRIDWGSIIQRIEPIDIGQGKPHDRKRMNQRIFKWLFIEIGFRWVWTTEVGKIFPVDYNWKTDVHYQDKLERLADTGYFS